MRIAAPFVLLRDLLCHQVIVFGTVLKVRPGTGNITNRTLRFQKRHACGFLPVVDSETVFSPSAIAHTKAAVANTKNTDANTASNVAITRITPDRAPDAHFARFHGYPCVLHPESRGRRDTAKALAKG